MGLSKIAGILMVASRLRGFSFVRPLADEFKKGIARELRPEHAA
jgi:hypothetical protein